MFINVDEPDTVSDPVTVKLPETRADPVIFIPGLQFRFSLPLLSLSCRFCQSIERSSERKTGGTVEKYCGSCWRTALSSR